MQRKDLLIGLIVIVVWGFNFIAIKLGVQAVPPLLLAVLRFLFTCFPAIFFLPKPPIPWRWLIALGLFLNVGQFSFLFMGIQLGMPAGLASLVMQSQAFFTLFMAVAWLGECLRWNNLAGLVLAACGMSLIGYLQGQTMTALGFWFILLAAASWGVGNVIMRRATLGVPPFSMLSLVVWSGMVAVLPLALLSLVFEGFASWVTAWHSLTWVSVGSFVYLGLFATLIGYGLWGKLLSRYPAAVVAPLALLVPLIGMSSSSLLLGESLSGWQLVGSALVMAGLVVHVFGAKWQKALDVKERSY